MRAIIATGLALILGTCSLPPSLLEQVQARGELHVLTRNSPTTYYLGPEEPTGLEYDLVRLFADHLGVELRVTVPDGLGAMFSQLEQGKADLAAAGLSVTDDRQERIRFGAPYHEVTQQLVYRFGNPAPRALDELDGVLKVVAGSSHEETLKKLAQDYPDLAWEAVDGLESEDLLIQVADRELDYTIADSVDLKMNRRYYPELRAAFDLAEPEPIAWAFPPGMDDSLRRAADDFLARLERRGTLAQIRDRHFGHTERFDYVGTRIFMRHIDNRLPTYRHWFETAADDYDLDWRLLAAIGYQESHWNPRAVSPTGVRGIMMLTQRTAGDMGVTNRIDPRQSIFGGARYFNRVHDRMPDHIEEPDRTWMALAAYNVGFYHLMDARILTEQHGANPDRWLDVRDHLPLLSQRQYYTQTRYGYARGREPVIYVDNIRRYYDILAWLMPQNGEAETLVEGEEESETDDQSG
ncbi:membrane-bound lytic murein transglycosylase MltF [Natronospira bacteriovora]|uniref:Membrane-bound lytic murein transglycosylase F n=1 Tax=Natronospira bacteriovora TaxID=3069753 RepID=A0ABU0W3U6_9GAMM|nr:membrane-bound lytic murein transglycosylase MltF [Natronospira sp. AB-CW4]MDQ2068694.1 membrane-bound lytic murein transglycosylase MltF [Natronospira sp. AB-CW4]